VTDESSEQLELQTLVMAMAPDVRRGLGQEWSALAGETYAGVARFAHFALELLAVAAPPELLEGANRAALDELGRARQCFGLASIYAGRELGTQPLPLRSQPSAQFDLASAVERVVRQGCVAEALAVAEFELVGTRALPAGVRRVNSLLLLGATEKLQLAHGFLRFALAEDAATARAAAERAFERALADHGAEPVPVSSVPDDVLRAHGRLTREERTQLRGGLALRVRPAADAALRGE
jgi:hypothetical protein